jgi:hypothetical protein
VGSSHRCTADGVRLAVVPGAEDADSRGPNINQSAVVREGRLGIVDVGGSNCEGSRLRCRGVVSSIAIVVASGDGEENS